MPPIHAIDRLNDLLCLMELRKTARHLADENYARAIVEWAEEAVIAGNNSEPLLILASLGLDAAPNEDEIRDYLGRFMIEAGLIYPGPNVSALVWLRAELTKLLQHQNLKDVEYHLAFFAINSADYPPPFFSKTCWQLSGLYYHLFDDAGGSYPSTVSTLTEAELLTIVQKEVTPYALVLSKDQWLSWLAGEPLPNR